MHIARISRVIATEALPLTNPDSEPSTPRLEIHAEEETKPKENIEEVTREAQEALAQYGAEEKITIEIMLRLGAAIAKAKAKLKHGEFARWCEEVLQRKPSWCSAHRRLYELQEFIEPALAYARRTGHRWAYCTSVERLLKLITEYQRAESGEQPAAQNARRKPAEIIAELQARIKEDDAEFLAMRDPLPNDVKAEVVELAASIKSREDEASKARLADIGRTYHWRYRDLVEYETCGAPQVSVPLLDETANVVPDNTETARSAEKVDASSGMKMKRPPREGMVVSGKISPVSSKVSPIGRIPWGRK
jgi:hypothetical protein